MSRHCPGDFATGARLSSYTGLKLTSATDLATTTPTPRPELSAYRIRYANQTAPWPATHHLSQPAQLPGRPLELRLRRSMLVARKIKAVTEEKLI
jgi:hypothetical protein